MNFNNFGLKDEVYRAFFGNFLNILPVQKKSIPIILNGDNIIISAGTGTGKTEAVLAPLISRYLDYALENDCLTWLYIAPTKALVNDIFRRIEPSFSNLHINLGIRHGDRDETHKSSILHLIITTPESLDVILARGDKTFSTIKAVII